MLQPHRFTKIYPTASAVVKNADENVGKFGGFTGEGRDVVVHDGNVFGNA